VRSILFPRHAHWATYLPAACLQLVRLHTSFTQSTSCRSTLVTPQRTTAYRFPTRNTNPNASSTSHNTVAFPRKARRVPRRTHHSTGLLSISSNLRSVPPSRASESRKRIGSRARDPALCDRGPQNYCTTSKLVKVFCLLHMYEFHEILPYCCACPRVHFCRLCFSRTSHNSYPVLGSSESRVQFMRNQNFETLLQ